MKAIKIIVGFISVLVVIFFTTGLVVKETNYTTQIVINKPVEEVFKIFNKPSNMKNWVPEIKTIDTLNFNPGITGSLFKIVVLNQGDEITMTEKIMAYVPNKKVTLFFDAENILKTNDYIFTEQNNTTSIKLYSTCKSNSYVMSCIFPYFEWKLKEQDQAHLNNFKKFVENK